MFTWLSDWYTNLVFQKRVAKDRGVFTSSLAGQALGVAARQIGRGELKKNNRGQWVRLYCGREGGAWCAGFVGWCFEHAAEELNLKLPFKRSLGAKKLFRNIGKAGSFHDTPRIGDAVCWQRGSGRPQDAWKGHIGIVVFADGEKFRSIEGNVGRFPAKVKEFAHTTDEKKLIGFARI